MKKLLNYLKLTNIRERVIVFFSVFTVIVVLIMAVATYNYFNYMTRNMILNQQFSMVTSMVKDLDEKIITAHTSLINVARVAPSDVTNRKEILQKWLLDRVGIRTIFSHSLFILDKNGTMLASFPQRNDIIGRSFAHRQYFIKSLSAGKPYISEPFKTAADDTPVIVMTAPIRLKDGEILGFLCGAVDLMKRDGFFSAIKDTRVGLNGYLYLFALDRTMIMHPDLTRIMKRDVLPGANVLFDKAINGFEGSGDTVNSKGLKFLASFKRLESTDWILAANYPSAEAYEPITTFRNYFLIGLLILIPVSVLLARWLAISITKPITMLTVQIRDLVQPAVNKHKLLNIPDLYELRLLANSFNYLLHEVNQREEEIIIAMQEADILRQKEKNANAAKSIFLANMSHEIRTPMNAIIGMTDLALMTTDEEELQNYLEIVKDSGTHLLQIINDVLDFSKIESGNLLLEQRDFHFKNIFHTVEKIYQFEISKKGLVLTLDISDELPVRVISDELRLRQVLINLIGNSIKFTEKGGINIRASIKRDIDVRPGYSAVEISVSDTGCGIPLEKQDLIFNKFQQSDMSTTRKFGGTGLGLSIAREVVHLMNGQISVKSEPGKGSEFTFWIIVENSRKTGSEEKLEKTGKKNSNFNNHFRILLAEDNEVNILLAVTVLKKLGNSVTVARNGAEALEFLRKDEFDLILMDIEMPEMDGLEATKRIRNGESGIDKSGIYIIAMTAHAVTDIKQNAMDAGMNDYITKPFDITKIQDSLEKLVLF